MNFNLLKTNTTRHTQIIRSYSAVTLSITVIKTS